MAAEGRQRCLVVVVWALLVAMALVPPTASVQWLRVVRHVRATLRVLNTIKNSLTVDLSSGQGDISSPDGLPVHVSAILHNRERSSSTSSSSSSSLSPLLSSSSLSAADAMLLASSGVEVVPSRSAAAAGAAADGDDSTLLWVHQVGKRVVRKVPDTALLGVLVLVAAELLRRGVKANRDTMPPLLRDFAETTITELDTKLEQLSSLEWQVRASKGDTRRDTSSQLLLLLLTRALCACWTAQVDPFFQAELENLQTQPLEVIDKFIVTQILPSVDKEFAPFLLKYMTGDTERVKTVTRNVKDLIELGVELLKIERVASLQKTKSSIIEQVPPLPPPSPTVSFSSPYCVLTHHGITVSRGGTGGRD